MSSTGKDIVFDGGIFEWAEEKNDGNYLEEEHERSGS
jgi:hypothetical protein